VVVYHANLGSSVELDLLRLGRPRQLWPRADLGWKRDALFISKRQFELQAPTNAAVELRIHNRPEPRVNNFWTVVD
jgi:hypothetical protein